MRKKYIMKSFLFLCFDRFFPTFKVETYTSIYFVNQLLLGKKKSTKKHLNRNANNAYMCKVSISNSKFYTMRYSKEPRICSAQRLNSRFGVSYIFCFLWNEFLTVKITILQCINFSKMIGPLYRIKLHVGPTKIPIPQQGSPEPPHPRRRLCYPFR